MKTDWARHYAGGYEVSSLGDKRFSALYAKMPDSRTIEQWYQCDVKGYDLGGTRWKFGKGKKPLFHYPGDTLWQMYLSLWRLWAIRNFGLMIELAQLVSVHENVLTDRFATTNINQAHALSVILNEWF